MKSELNCPLCNKNLYFIHEETGCVVSLGHCVGQYVSIMAENDLEILNKLLDPNWKPSEQCHFWFGEYMKEEDLISEFNNVFT